MSTFAALCAEPFAPAQGVPAVVGTNDYKLIVQVAKVSSGKVLGTMVLGDPLAGKQWVDVTGDAHGIEITRGAAAGNRPGAGQLNFWLSNDSGTHDPSANSFNGPGTLVRVGLWMYDSSVVLFTGLTVAWNEQTDAIGAVRWVEVEAIETISLLGESDKPAISPIGAGENVAARVARILASADWAFASAVSAAGGADAWGLQATSLAQDAWTELLLTTDSLALTALSARDGSLLVRERVLATSPIELGGAGFPVVADSIETANDDETLLGQVAVARVGGTAVTYTNSSINGRYQQRSTQRFDLITQDPGTDLDLARFANDLLARSRETYRVKSVKLDNGDDNATAHPALTIVSLLDIGQQVHVTMPVSSTEAVHFTYYIVCAYTLAIEPQNDKQVHIVATVETDVLGAVTQWERY